MGIYKFRVCEKQDYPLLVDFIRMYWNPNHILVRNKEIMDFQYYDKEREQYNFLLAENQETGKIDGIRGWIRVSQFDPALAPNDDVWSAVWKVCTDVVNPEIKILGSYLGRYLNKHKGFGTIGISKFSFAMHSAMRHVMCSCSQYFILNPNLKDFKVAKIPAGFIPIKGSDNNWSLKEIEDIRTIKDKDVPAYYRPFKSIIYFYNRFQKHPMWKYNFWGVYNDDKIVAILAGRFLNANGGKILHIVDVLGSLEEVGCLYVDFVKIVKDTGCEYVDFLCYGVCDEVFARMGFNKLNLNGKDLVIPQYFEPFLQENITINAAFKPAEKYTFFKADADQDRPS